MSWIPLELLESFGPLLRTISYLFIFLNSQKYCPSSTMITGISLILGLLVLNMLPYFPSLFSLMPLVYVCVYVFFGGFIITDIMIPLTMHLLLTNVFLYNFTKIVLSENLTLKQYCLSDSQILFQFFQLCLL